MIDSQIRARFTEIAGGEPAPSRVDTQLAHRRGRARLRWRRACVGTTPVLAAVVAVAVAVGAAPFRPGSGPPAAGSAPPRQFNPLIPYVSFGWLPAGNKLVAGAAAEKTVGLVAGPKLLARSEWSLTLYAAGQCRLTASARELNCSLRGWAPDKTLISGRAPAVRGHGAFWSGPLLVWQYARGGWAKLVLPFPYDSPLLHNAAKREAIKRDAVKVAQHVRYGAATPPLVFPAQLTGLPSQWRVASVYYRPDAGVLRASQYPLNAVAAAGSVTSDGGLQYQNNLPWFEIDPVTSLHNPCHRYPNRKKSGTRSIIETINGYRVVVNYQAERTVSLQGATRALYTQDLCAANARGLVVHITENGQHPLISVVSLFRDHLRLLGTNPANWTRKPIG